VIFRREFTDLKDSTIKDFELYSGLTVTSSRDIKFSNGSQILFRHLEEINNIQNINLGFFLLEQAEEMESDSEFTMLRGRLRRTNCLQQGMVIANTRGHNWIYKNWKLKNLENSFLVEAKTFDNAENLPEKYLEDLKLLKTSKSSIYKRFVENSWDEADTTDLIIYPEWVETATKKSVFSNPIEKRRIISIDVSRYGDDKTVFYAIENNRWIAKEEHQKISTMETVGRAQIFSEKFLKTNNYAVDEIGVGGGVADRLAELGKNVISVNSSKKSSVNNFYNLRAEIYSLGAELLSEGHIQIDKSDTDLLEQLSWAKYTTIKSNGIYQVESKDEIKKRYGRSPDNADAFLNGIWALKQVCPEMENNSGEQNMVGWVHPRYRKRMCA